MKQQCSMTRRTLVRATSAAMAGAAAVGASLGGRARLAQADMADGTPEGTYARRSSGKEQFAIAPAKKSDLGEPDESCD